MKTHLIYATSNVGKIIEIRRLFGFHGITIEPLSDFSPNKLDPEETGVSLGQNAFIKASAYAREIVDQHHLRGSRFIVMSDDTGVFIDALNGEPGIKVRRWIGLPMTDEEIIEYTIQHMADVLDDARRTAHFKTSLCFMSVDQDGVIGQPLNFEAALDGRILKKAHSLRVPGFPFESIFWDTEHDMLLGDLHRLPEEEKRKGKFNHRERAIEEAIPVIKGIINSN